MTPPRQPVTVLIASYLEPEHVERIRAVSGIRVLYDPALLPAPRYTCDHVGHPLTRSSDDERRWRGYLAEAEVMFDFDYPNLRGLKDLIPRVRWIQATSTGIGQTLIRAGLIESPIVFTTARGTHAKPLADFVLMAILWFAKDGFRMVRDQAAHRWARYCGRDLRGATVGVVGLGTIGREVARVCTAMGMRVMGVRRTPTPDDVIQDVDVVLPVSEVARMLEAADYLVLAAPHTPDTDRLIGRDELSRIKPGAVLINVARGAIVDEPAMIEALRAGRLSGAALDVFATEPPAPDNPLWDMPNVLISPHSASTVETENATLTDLFCENLDRYLRGTALLNVFDRERLY
ncbi:MAG: D-2-hydroxyacid dehydrogenase [Armatimonadota bacterium]|nr:D-2-hydroxyacid dehydrogenase [Armatimonadota bacterium]